MSQKTVRAFAAIAIHVALVFSGCTSPPAATSSSDAGAALDAVSFGVGSVIPAFAGDGSTGPGSVPVGVDGSALAPCLREASSDAQEESAPADAQVDAACSTPLAPGDLVIDELMIASQAGGGDHGEWLEVTSTKDCAIDLQGLYAEAPHGAGMTLATIATHLVLPPRGFFVIADSTAAPTNHDLPGIVVAWGTGTGSDVLLNSGDTITLYTASATIDSLTYPAPSMLVDGASMAFPSDCDPSLRTAFGNWQPSIGAWTPGYFGTPGAPNADVRCAAAPPPPQTGSPCGDGSP